MTICAEGCSGCSLDNTDQICRIKSCCHDLKINNECPCRTCVVKVKCRQICVLLMKYSSKVFNMKGSK